MEFIIISWLLIGLGTLVAWLLRNVIYSKLSFGVQAHLRFFLFFISYFILTASSLVALSHKYYKLLATKQSLDTDILGQ